MVRDASKSFVNNYKTSDFRDEIKLMLNDYHELECCTLLKIDFLESHLSSVLEQTQNRGFEKRHQDKTIAG